MQPRHHCDARPANRAPFPQRYPARRALAQADDQVRDPTYQRRCLVQEQSPHRQRPDHLASNAATSRTAIRHYPHCFALASQGRSSRQTPLVHLLPTDGRCRSQAWADALLFEGRNWPDSGSVPGRRAPPAGTRRAAMCHCRHASLRQPGWETSCPAHFSHQALTRRGPSHRHQYWICLDAAYQTPAAPRPIQRLLERDERFQRSDPLTTNWWRHDRAPIRAMGQGKTSKTGGLPEVPQPAARTKS